MHARDDGFGRLLLDCWAAGPRPHTFLQVIERDDGFVSCEDAYRYFSVPKEWVEPELTAVLRARGRVLDVGCAAGRHATVMAEQGCEVVGIDPSPGAVKVAAERGVDARLGTILEPGDVGSFDTITLLGGNLGLLGSRRRSTVALYRLATVARPDARLLAVGHDPYATDDPVHLAYHEHNRWRGLLPGQIHMRLRYKDMMSEWFDRLLLSPAELPGLLTVTPWRLADVAVDGKSGFYLAEMALARQVDVLDHTCAAECVSVHDYPWMGCQALAAEIDVRRHRPKADGTPDPPKPSAPPSGRDH
jgi:SAM-dependent methyltransferase